MYTMLILPRKTTFAEEEFITRREEKELILYTNFQYHKKPIGL